MGKASSSKKVARAAGTGGGRANRNSTPWTYVSLLALIVVIGLALTFTSRNRAHVLKNALSTANATVQPTVGGTAWNEGLAVYICNAFVAPITATSDPEGITTTGNGVIHIAPKVKAAAGKNATLGELARSVGMSLSGSQLQLPGATKHVNGDDCSGKPAKVYIKQFAYAGAPTGNILTQDPASIPLADKALLTVAFVPPADKSRIPAPPASIQAALRLAVTPTTTTVPATTVPTTTVPARTTTKSTTAKAASPSTNASSSTTRGSTTSST